MPIDPGKIRPHVSEVVRAVVCALPEMNRKKFDYGIVPADSGKKGLGRNLSEWGAVVAQIVQSLAVSRGYPRPRAEAVARETHAITLTEGITALAKKISEMT